MTELARILLVEDDQMLAEMVQAVLQGTGEFQVEIEPRGDRAVQRILAEDPDLVVLDIMLPGKDGFAVCREVRAKYDRPILILTSLEDEVDEVAGLEIGADDYVAKPAGPRKLLARIRALLRRTENGAGGRGDVLEVGALVVDVTNRCATLRGQPIELTTAEFDLLCLMARRPGKPVMRDDIYRQLRGIEWDGLDRSVDQRVARLRRKLGDDARQPALLKSVRGVGYLLAVIE